MSTQDASRFSIASADSRIFLSSETASRTPASAATAEKEASALCVPDLVRRNAALAPGALALQDASVRLTYKELEGRSNQLARYLSSLGAIPGNIVGLCLERSVEFVVAALAVLKAGAAYLPLDTKTPADRLKMMLRDAQASVVVAQPALLAALAGSARQVVVLDRCADEIGRCSRDSLPVQVTPECLAYVIYTSGSTGTPKAVAVGHDGLLNLVAWHNRAFGVTASDVATQLASIGFDAAVWELWPHLVAGASVHVVDDTVRMEPERLRDWLAREKITITFVPTPLAERMINLPWPEHTSLRFLLTGADTLHYYPPAGLPFQLVNNYGPTECTVVATSAIIPPWNAPPQRNAASLPPIGRPVDGAEIYILDHSMKQVPDGQLGEICIGGAGLAKGYLNDAKLTAERFVPHPFSKVAGARLYRTGDVGCFLPDGQIVFHGRVDDQVKIRGHRIELNEIIGALSRHPAVRQCVVVGSEDGQGEKHLVAYVVAQPPSLTVSELRDFLARELPNYMIPGTFVSLASLPIGATGKVDRSALPAPSDENLLRDEAFVCARTPMEERVAGIVTSLLGLDGNSMGVNDNFFYFGGNSLFGTQVIARLRETFDVELPLLRLFDYPTIAGLATEVERLMVAKLEAMSEEEAQRLLARNEQPGL
jgi:amino acid adenylation domain-containing protein